MLTDAVISRIQGVFVKTLGQELVSLYIYGSAASDDMAPGSDINSLLILKTVELPILDRVRECIRVLRQDRVNTPLVLTLDQIKRSADVFPIEYLEIQEKHRLLFGVNHMAKLKISNRNLRHECEHELRGRIMRMRGSYLEMQPQAAAVQQLLLTGHNANLPAMRTALRMKKIKPPVRKDDVIVALAKQFGLRGEVFARVHELRNHPQRLNNNAACILFEEYLHELEKLATQVDRM